MRSLLFLVLFVPGVLLAETTPIDIHLIEIRYCGAPERYADGSIKRRTDVIREFERRYPLPENYNRDEWEIDHIIPLALGGCDAIWNMQWLPKAIKRCSKTAPLNKDCFERKIYPNTFSLILDDTKKGLWSMFQLPITDNGLLKLDNRGMLYPPVILQQPTIIEPLIPLLP